MGRKKKTYLDLFLDNAEKTKKKKKKKPYFQQREEDAILEYNDAGTSQKRKGELYVNIIEPAFKEMVSGVLEMPKFRRLPRGMERQQLVESTFFRLIEKIDKFTPDLIGKNGSQVKAFSYFSTIAKNYILEKKLRHEKILKNKADVETSINLSILSEDTLKMMSNYDMTDVYLYTPEGAFNAMKEQIVAVIEEVIRSEEIKPEKRRDENFIKIGYVIKYLLTKWNLIEFRKKNEFMRILTLYTGMKQQQVSFLFKKFKVAVTKKIRPDGMNRGKSISKEPEAEYEDGSSFGISYPINSLEDYELIEEKNYNKQIKKGLNGKRTDA